MISRIAVSTQKRWPPKWLLTEYWRRHIVISWWNLPWIILYIAQSAFYSRLFSRNFTGEAKLSIVCTSCWTFSYSWLIPIKQSGGAWQMLAPGIIAVTPLLKWRCSKCNWWGNYRHWWAMHRLICKTIPCSTYLEVAETTFLEVLGLKHVFFASRPRLVYVTLQLELRRQMIETLQPKQRQNNGFTDHAHLLHTLHDIQGGPKEVSHYQMIKKSY